MIINIKFKHFGLLKLYSYEIYVYFSYLAFLLKVIKEWRKWQWQEKNKLIQKGAANSDSEKRS